MTTDSRNRNGTLTVDGKAFATQTTNVRISPDYKESGDTIELLSGAELPADKRRTNALNVEAVQDFDDPEGFAAFTWAHDLETVAFSWRPNPTAPTYSGQVQVLAVEIGGEVGARLTTAAEWPIVGPVTVTPATPPADDPEAD